MSDDNSAPTPASPARLKGSCWQLQLHGTERTWRQTPPPQPKTANLNLVMQHCFSTGQGSNWVSRKTATVECFSCCCTCICIRTWKDVVVNSIVLSWASFFPTGFWFAKIFSLAGNMMWPCDELTIRLSIIWTWPIIKACKLNLNF